MSEGRPGPAALRAVPDRGSDEAASTEASTNGLTPPRRGGSRLITDVLVELDFVAAERVKAAVEEGKAERRPPEQVLLEAGAITGDQLSRAVAQRFGLQHVDLSIYKTDVAALNLISPPAARRLGSVPIGFDDGGHLLVAMSDPSNVLALDDLKLMTGHEVLPVVAGIDDIHGLIGRMSKLDDAVAAAVKEGEDEIDEVAEVRETADDAPVIKLVNSIIAQGVEDGASDIHFEPEGRDMRVRFRVDGVLRESTHIPRRMVAGTVSRVKIMANLDIAEKRVPQDGRVSLTVEGHAIDLRIVTMPHVEGEGARDAHPRQDPGADRARPAGHVEPGRDDVRGRLPALLRRRAGDRPDGLGQVHHALRGAERDQRARAQHHHDRGPGRVPARRA